MDFFFFKLLLSFVYCKTFTVNTNYELLGRKMYSLSSSEVRIGFGVNSWKGAEQLWSKSTQNKQIKISGAAAGDCSGVRLFFFFFFLLLFSQMVEGRRLFNRRRSGSCRLHRPLVALLLSWREDNSHVVSVKERKEGIGFLFPVVFPVFRCVPLDVVGQVIRLSSFL